MRASMMIAILTALASAATGLQSPALGETMLFGRGVNLVGNHGFYARMNTWATPAGMNFYLAKGMRNYRINVVWEWLQPRLNGDLDRTVIAALRTEVDFLTAAGGYVIIDIHNYMRRDLNFHVAPKKSGNTPKQEFIVGETPEVTAAHLADLWTRLALVFKDNPKVMFGIMNEPHDVDGSTLAATYNTVIDSIRKTGATNVIMLDGIGFVSDLSWSGEKKGTPLGPLVRDPGNNLIIDVHTYLDDYGAGQKQTCNPGAGASNLVHATQWARDNHYRLFLGEFAVGKNPDCYRELGDLLDYVGANTDIWTGYAWFGVYAGQKGYNTPDTGFWYTLDPGGGDVQDFSGKTPDDPRLTILLGGPS